MKRVVIDTDKTAKVIHPYSKAIKVVSPKSVIFVSGQGARDIEGDVVKGDIKTQTKQVFERIKYVLEAGGATLKDVVKITTYLRNKDDYAGFNEIRRQYFEDDFPASTLIVVKGLVEEDMLVEVEAIAAL